MITFNVLHKKITSFLFFTFVTFYYCAIITYLESTRAGNFQESSTAMYFLKLIHIRTFVFKHILRIKRYEQSAEKLLNTTPL